MQIAGVFRPVALTRGESTNVGVLEPNIRSAHGFAWKHADKATERKIKTRIALQGRSGGQVTK